MTLACTVGEAACGAGVGAAGADVGAAMDDVGVVPGAVGVDEDAPCFEGCEDAIVGLAVGCALGAAAGLVAVPILPLAADGAAVGLAAEDRTPQ